MQPRSTKERWTFPEQHATIGSVSKAQILKRLNELSEQEFDRVAPFLEADLEAIEHLDELQAEIAKGRHSAVSEPMLDEAAVYERARSALRK